LLAILPGKHQRMVSIALFHSVLGVRPGVHAAADLLRSHGYSVIIVDQYHGKVFDDYEEANTFATGIGYPALMQSAAQAVSKRDGPLVVAGFSNGGGMAEYVATTTAGVVGALLFSGALDPAMIGVDRWPAAVPLQIHYTEDDPFRNQAGIDAVAALVADAGAIVETFDYPGSGHLFTDPSMRAEYQPQETALLWSRTLVFLEEVASGQL
jgi:dienelactone hydrolase